METITACTVMSLDYINGDHYSLYSNGHWTILMETITACTVMVTGLY